MSTQAAVRRPGDHRADTVVSALVSAGLLDPAHRSDALAVVDRALRGQHRMPESMRQRFAELAGYVGGAFVVSAAAVFFATNWEDLSSGAQVGLLFAVAAVLAAAGAALAMTGGGFGVLREGGQPVRRRLTSVLFAGGSVAAAGAAGVEVDAAMRISGSEPVMAAAWTMLLLGVAAYTLVPTALGQVVLAAAVVMGVPATLDTVGDVDATGYGLVTLGCGLVWLLLAERGVWREIESARAVGALLAVVGAQIPVGSEHSWVGYLATLLVAAAGFAMYVARRSWPYLAAGVAGLTLAVPEAVVDWTEGSLGPAGVLLVAGVSLLGASLIGLRLRH
jgi:uncharacterized membrane protein